MFTSVLQQIVYSIFPIIFLKEGEIPLDEVCITRVSKLNDKIEYRSKSNKSITSKSNLKLVINWYVMINLGPKSGIMGNIRKANNKLIY